MTIDTSNSSNSHFSAEELAQLAELEKLDTTQIPPSDEQQAAAPTAPAGNAPPATVPADTTSSPAPAAPAEPAAPAPAQDDRSQGDVRAALRASRRAERHAREQAERLQRENEELRARTAAAPAPAPAQDPRIEDFTPEQLEEMKQDFPGQYALLLKVKELEARVPAAAAPAPASNAQQDEFLPVALPEDVQEAVDKVPDLLAWQLDPDQKRWTAAIQADAMLLQSPKWADKPMEVRYAEVARLVNDQFGTPSQQQQQGAADLEAARRVIEQQARTTPMSISDIRGGTSPHHATTPDYSRMSDEQILASLG